MTRRERIVFLLDHWQDFFEPGGTMAMAGEPAEGVALLPLMSRHRSVVELARCLEVVHGKWPTHYKHVVAWFGCEWRVCDRPKSMKTRSGKRTIVLVRVRERVIPKDMRKIPLDAETREPRSVALIVDYVSGIFEGEVYIPKDLLASVA